MCNAAILKLIGNLGQIQLLIEQKLFCFFDLMKDDVLLYSDAFYFRKNI